MLWFPIEIIRFWWHLTLKAKFYYILLHLSFVA